MDFFPPPVIRKFLTSEFVNLFIFDGELARNLLDSNQTRARDAIDALFQLSLFNGVANQFQVNWESHEANTSSKTEQGLNRRRNKLKSFKPKKKRNQSKTKRTTFTKISY